MAKWQNININLKVSLHRPIDAIRNQDKPCDKWEIHIGEYFRNPSIHKYVAARGRKQSRSSMPQ